MVADGPDGSAGEPQKGIYKTSFGILLLTWLRGLALVHASLVKGPHRNAACYYPINGSLFVGADDPGRSRFSPPRLRKGVAPEVILG